MAVEISVVCPVTRHATALAAGYAEYAKVLAATGRSVEFLYVIDGPRDDVAQTLTAIEDDRFQVRVFRTARGFGESTALQVGFEKARGRIVLTVPDRPQIDPEVLTRVLAELDAGHEAVVTRRDPRTDALPNRIQSRVFHSLVRRAVGQRFHDLTCGVRGFTRDAARRLDLYGDQHRFIPVIAMRNGHRVVEISAPQHPDNKALRLREPFVYARRILDIFNIFFLARFTRKPLRFFGSVGLSLGLAGFAITAWLTIQRLLKISALADRPLLLLGVLLIVLGVQVTAIGMLAEIIIFFAARRDIPEVGEVGDVSPASRSRRDAS